MGKINFGALRAKCPGKIFAKSNLKLDKISNLCYNLITKKERKKVMKKIRELDSKYCDLIGFCIGCIIGFVIWAILAF